MFNDFLATKLATLATLLRPLLRHGPHLAIALALPGGLLVAAALWLFKHKHGKV
jgi:predicted membrane protein